ncbi:MAG: helix-turn-helix domain-containing protein [Azospirillaceae bacterium]|nr:helix-turn-helix domain-containing protein [Azospirillaceae bacterium]
MNLSDDKCPIARGLACAGDTWSILILRDASQGLTRFDQFRKSLGIAPTILTRRLAALTDEGLLEKRRYSDHPPRDEYVLTPAGQDFMPIIVMIGAWALRHRNSEATTRFFDAQTGREITPVAVDAASGEPIGSRPISLGTAAPHS